MPKTFLIIPVYNRCQTTLSCLKNLSEVGVCNWAKVVIVDDGSSDRTREKVKEQFPQVEVLSGDGSLWWTGGTKKGMQFAMQHGAECIVWLNDDCRPKLGTLEKLTEYAEGHSCITSAQSATLSGYFYGGQRKTWLGLKPIFSKRNEIKNCSCCHGNCVAMPASVVRAIGYPDAQAFPQIRGDSDYVLRAVRAGFSCSVVGNAICDNDDNLSLFMRSWLLDDVPLRDIWKHSLSVNNMNVRSNFLFYTRYWSVWGAVLFALPYIRFACIAVIRLLFSKRLLRAVYGGKSEAWRRTQHYSKQPRSKW
jgi:GT2 family glycosyltransferase